MASESWRGARLTSNDTTGSVLLFVIALVLLVALMRQQERYHALVEKLVAQK